MLGPVRYSLILALATVAAATFFGYRPSIAQRIFAKLLIEENRIARALIVSQLTVVTFDIAQMQFEYTSERSDDFMLCFFFLR